MRVLLVDDSSTMRTIQKRCLKQLSIEDVVEAGDGAEALERFGEGGIDLIMSDWNMPVMNGLDFLKAVREKNAEIPFIMITTESENANVAAAVQAGVSDYLTKPFSPDDLRTALQKWVQVPA